VNIQESTSVKLDTLQRKVEGSLESRIRALEAGLTDQRESLQVHEDCLQKNMQGKIKEIAGARSTSYFNRNYVAIPADIRKIDDVSIALEATNVQVAVAIPPALL
jgi:hypothetical protein